MNLDKIKCKALCKFRTGWDGELDVKGTVDLEMDGKSLGSFNFMDTEEKGTVLMSASKGIEEVAKTIVSNLDIEILGREIPLLEGRCVEFKFKASNPYIG